MAKIIPVCKGNKELYRIYIEDSFLNLGLVLNELELQNRKICIITDDNVSKLYEATVRSSIDKIAAKITTFVMNAGEENKNLHTVENLYEHLIENQFSRKDLLLALGGGVVGDLCGYCAATYLRGIDFIQIPTTLLAQTDSSIGGKTGVDFQKYKNMVGAFHMPKLVYMNLSVLKSLDNRQFASGMAEVLKYGLIKNGEYYEWLIDHFNEINDRENEILEEMIYQSCLVKKAVVEKDPTEQGERALLNFGHTIGHAIEKYMDFKYTHGECVALGSVAAAYISYQRKMLSTEEFYEIRDMFVPFSLPISITDVDAKKIVALTKSDKKMEGNHVKFILLKKIGKAVIDKTVSDEEMIQAVNELIFDEKV